MRFFPVIAAIIVSALVYVFVLDRERLTGTTPEGDASAMDQPSAETEAAIHDTTGPVAVVAIHSVARVIDSAVILRGQTEADRQVEVRAETSGQIISDPLRKGAFVTDDQMLCRLDAGTRSASLAEATARLAEATARVPEASARLPEAQARVEESRARVQEAKARVVEANINVNAARKLKEDGFASESRVAGAEAELSGAKATLSSAQAGLKSAESGLESAAAGIETATAGVQSARAAVAAADKEIERLEIAAPFAGVLETDTAELGTLLQPGALCATIIQLDPIILVGFAPETQVDRITVGADAGAQLTSGKQIRGKVRFLSRSADPTTRTFRVEIVVPNSDLAIRDGLTAEILIASDGKPAHLLPNSVLTLNNGGDLGVRIVTEDNMAFFVPVTVLRDTPEGIWLAGLPDAADVIVIGQEYVIDNVAVVPSFQELGQ